MLLNKKENLPNDIIVQDGYFAKVSFSAEDNVFFGKVLGIKDLVSFQGLTVEELKTDMREAIQEYKETCIYLDKPYEPEINNYEYEQSILEDLFSSMHTYVEKDYVNKLRAMLKQQNGTGTFIENLITLIVSLPIIQKEKGK